MASKYQKEFRDSTVQLALNSDKSVSKIGEDLGVNPKTIFNWIREYRIANNIKTDNRQITKSSSTKESFEDEAKRLRKENKLLKQERDILKKATAYFAKEVI